LTYSTVRKNWKIPKGYSEDVIRTMTVNTMAHKGQKGKQLSTIHYAEK